MLEIDRQLDTDNLALSISFCSEIKEICRPLLQKTKIQYFNFARKFLDGSNFSLTTHPEWSLYYYQNGCFGPVDEHRNLEGLRREEEENGFRRLFRTQFDDCPVGHICREDFGIDVSLSLTSISDNYYDCYFFGGKTGEYMDELITLYTQYPTIFSHFIFYFHDRAHHIIEKMQEKKNRIIIPKPIKRETIHVVRNGIELHETTLPDDIQSLFDDFSNKKYRLVVANEEFFLTLREMQTLSLWLKGNTVKKIANILTISSRTVETHLDKIKLKLNCYTKDDVINKVLGDPELTTNNTGHIPSNLNLIDNILWG